MVEADHFGRVFLWCAALKFVLVHGLVSHDQKQVSVPTILREGGRSDTDADLNGVVFIDHHSMVIEGLLDTLDGGDRLSFFNTGQDGNELVSSIPNTGIRIAQLIAQWWRTASSLKLVEADPRR